MGKRSWVVRALISLCIHSLTHSFRYESANGYIECLADPELENMEIIPIRAILDTVPALKPNKEQC